MRVRHTGKQPLVGLDIRRPAGVPAPLRGSRKIIARAVFGPDRPALIGGGANAQELLQRLVSSGAILTKFELVEPSLNDIFIEKVREAA